MPRCTFAAYVLALLIPALAFWPASRAVAQWGTEPTADPFRQRDIRAPVNRDGATDIDPLPPLNATPPPNNYPRMAAAPPGNYLPAAYPPNAYPTNSYPPAAYQPGPPVGPPVSSVPVSPPPLPGPAGTSYPADTPLPGPAGAPYPAAAQWQQLPPPAISVPPASGDNVPSLAPYVPSGPNSFTRLLDHLEGNVVARGFYRNDQRVTWSGMEETFGGEADLTPRLRYRTGDFEFLVDTEFWINQPFEKSPLLNNQERKSYAADFQVNTFDVGQLALVTNYGDWTFKIGKFVTPFGRAYYPIYTNPYLYPNQALDQPFIRTEVIQNRETGVLAHYKTGYFVGDLALSNGGDNLDTNSSKALIARLGLESDNWAIGVSAKKEDGDGSEDLKEFGSYFGIDMMVRQKPFTLSAECVYDEYGFGRPAFNPMNIYWAKNIYYRDVSTGQQGVPCTGIGYYVDLNYAEGRWDATLDYGDFYPLYTGAAPNQRVQHRGLVKVAYRWAEPLQSYTIVIVENDGYPAQLGYARSGIAVVQGFQFTF